MNAPLGKLPVPGSRKAQVLRFIIAYRDEHGVSPSMDEIAAALGVSDTRAKFYVHQLANATPPICRGPAVG